MNAVRILAAMLALSAALAACSSPPFGGGPPPPPKYCAGLAPPLLVYPAPNATGVPDGNFQVYVSYPENPSVDFSGPFVTSSAGAIVDGGNWASPTPGPTPGVVNPNGDEFFAASMPSLAPATEYTLSVSDDLCSNGYFKLGTFTTQ
jgi:hypothetical protein